MVDEGGNLYARIIRKTKDELKSSFQINGQKECKKRSFSRFLGYLIYQRTLAWALDLLKGRLKILDFIFPK